MRRLALVASLLALAVAAGAIDLSSRGINVASSVSDGDRTITTLKDTAGRTFTVSYRVEPSQAVLEQIVRIRDLLATFKNVKGGSLRFTVTGALIETLLIPHQFGVTGQDLRPYVTAGLFFTYTDSLEYDFRVTKDNLFMRIRGPFSGEDALEAEVQSAVADPAKFVQRSDPNYVLNHLDQVESKLTSLGKAIDALTQMTNTLAESTTALQQSLQESAAALGDQLAQQGDQLAQQKDALAQQKDVLAAQNQALQKEVELLRFAAMRSENVEWFTARALPRDGVSRVLALKQEIPTLTVADVSKQLKAEKVTISDKEIRLVFAYYLGEY